MGGGERRESEEAVAALRRVATSRTKGSDRTSYLTRARCARLPPFSPSRPFRFHHPFPPPLFRRFPPLSLSPRPVRRAPPFFPPPRPPPPRVPRRLGSLFIFISFGLVCGSRLGTVITEYPPLTSSTLVVLSLGLLPLVYHPLIPPPVPPPPLRHSLLSFANAPGRRRHDDV